MVAQLADATSQVRQRILHVAERGRALEAEGIRFDTEGVLQEVKSALVRRDVASALTALNRSEALLDKTLHDWNWLRGLLGRLDELRELAGQTGFDLALVDQRLGNARAQLQSGSLAAGALEKAAASASLALVVLSETLPKYYAQESQQLARSIREARERGEDVHEASAEMAQLVQSFREGSLPVIAQRFLDLRRAVTRIPPAPAVPSPMSEHEEEEILLEARNLARRLNRMKYRARDAQSAARLMTQVRAALSEDRRYGSPEEELEELWGEVDRLARERMNALGPLEAEEPAEVPPAETEPEPEPPAEPEPQPAPDPEAEVPAPTSARRSRPPA
jgi:hypothetical protein